MAQDPIASVDAERARAAAVADDAFGADLYRLLGASGENTVFSPASIAAALRMALCGARGETAAQIAAALHLSGPEAASEGLRLLSGELAGARGAGEAPDPRDGGAAVTLRAPNTMWVQDGLALLPEFTGQLREAAAVTARQADFRTAPEKARAEINQLIEEQTAGKITGLLGPGAIGPLTRLVLANAVYLKAAWAHPFPAHATGDAPFCPDGDGTGPAMTVQMMRLTADMPYTQGEGYQAVLLPYRASRLAMGVVLPDGPLSSLAVRLAGRGLRGLLAAAERRRVALSMPKFRQQARFGLIPVLRQLGAGTAFTDRADFSGITRDEPLSIGAVVHQAYIDVDEQGTEAAAATAVAMRPMAVMRAPEPVTMIVDRPFLFAIIDSGTGLPLFLGQVRRPATR
jgi:serpin B